MALVISRDKSFQSLGAEATKAKSPRVVKVFKFRGHSSIPSLDGSLYLESGLILTRPLRWIGTLKGMYGYQQFCLKLEGGGGRQAI